MLTFHRFGTRLGSGVACLCLSAVCAAPAGAQTDWNAPSADASVCRLVAGQAEIDGAVQQITGRACLQPDGSWQIVEDDAAAQALSPDYDYGTWYWGPPVVSGVGVSFIFVDRFHRFHRMDHVRYSRGSYGVRGHGGWHGRSSTQTWGVSHGGGMSHGGGSGMRR